jgi:hypothetical protein
LWIFLVHFPIATGQAQHLERFGAAVAGQVIDLEPDEGALDDQQFPVVVLPPGT